jgi:hypothetical protein
MEMTMTQNEIIEAIKAERVRQDELHPILAQKMLPVEMTSGMMVILSNRVKQENAIDEANDVISWYDVFREELFEVFAETDPARIKEEAIQLAALCVRLCETL